MNAWIVVLLAGLGSYAFRLSMILAADRVRMPMQLEHASGFVSPAAFAALAMTSVAGAVIGAGVGQATPPIVAVAVAVLAVLRTGSPVAALLAGMPALWLTTALFSI